MTTYQISDKLLWGFRITIENNQNPIEIMKNQLINFFQEKNLVYLEDRVRKIDLHIHNYNSDNNGIIYICSCHKINDTNE